MTKAEKTVKKKTDKKVKKVEDKVVSSKPKAVNKMQKTAVVAVAGLLAVLLLSIIPVFGQSLLSRGLDAVGAHKAALKTDLMTSKNEAFANKLAAVNFQDPENCADLWENLVSQEIEEVNAQSQKYMYQISPVNSEYKDSAVIRVTGDMAVDMEQQAMSVALGMTVKADKGLVESFGLDLADKITLDLEAKGVSTVEGAYFSIPKIDVSSNGESYSTQFNDWYGQELSITDTQKDGISDLAALAKEISLISLDEIISSDTGEYAMEAFCGLIKDAEVGGIDTYSFGPDGEYSTKSREIVFEVNLEDGGKNLEATLPELADKIINDDLLEEFVSGKYDTLSDLQDAMVKMTGDDDIVPLPATEGDYKEMVKEAFEGARDDFDKDEMKEGIAGEFDIEKEAQDMIEHIKFYSYINQKTDKIDSIKIEVKIMLPEEAFTEGDQMDFLKDGIMLSYQVYEIRTNDEVAEIEVPISTKSIEQFMEDIEGSELGNGIMTLSELFSDYTSFQDDNANIYIDDYDYQYYDEDYNDEDYQSYEDYFSGVDYEESE